MVCLGSFRFLRAPFVGFNLLVIAATVTSAQQASPRVQFDAPYVIAVRELPAAPNALPDEKIVEARFDVSSIITAGSERDVSQFVFQVQSLQRTMQVQDYQPRSTRDTAIRGNITISEGREDANSSALDISGKYQELTQAKLHFGQSTKENGSQRFERLPALETVVASGTIYRGTGVYFKLHTTDRQLLEGATTLSIQWCVPVSWRADYIHLRCIAEGRVRNQTQRIGQRDFLIPVYLAGDAAAQQAAIQFARSEASLRMAARQYATELTNKSPSPWSRPVSILVGDHDDAVPHDWLERLLYLPSNPQIPARLPATVRKSAANFLVAREELALLHGWQAAANAQASNVR
jgi:hypothetical protein